MRPIWNSLLSATLLVVVLSGCATSKEVLMPHGDATMADIWNRYTGAGIRGAARDMLDARQQLRRPPDADAMDETAVDASYTRTAQNEIHAQFRRLPNPDLVMYVFPHLAGTEQVPVPGYSTIFPMHRQVHYSMPGERTETY